MEIELLPTDRLIPYARNPRRNADAITKVAASIKEFGFRQPIVVDEEMVVVVGHTRLEAAKSLGIKQVPVHIARGLTDAQVRAYRLADNRTNEEAEWDEELLRLEFSQLEEAGYDLDLTGFDADEIKNISIEQTEGQTDEDATPEVMAEPVTVSGDIWLLGKHRLMCGDSTSIDAVEKLMDGQKADMVFTDPPYGMHLNADYSDMSSKFKGSKGGNRYDNVIGDHNDFSPDSIQTVFANFEYCKEIFLWGADYYSDLLPNKNDGSWIVWDKRCDDSADKMFGSTFELCWSKNRHKRDMARVKWAGIFGMEKEHDKKRVHPTQKPSALIEWFFDKWGSKGDVVADLFGGSGSTLIACEKTGRSSRLMELDPKYCDVIVRRWQDFTGKQATLESTGETFWQVAERLGIKAD